MVERDVFVKQLDDLLEIEGVSDWGPNGLQVQGQKELSCVVTGVTSSLALIQAAVERGAQAIVVHHGIFWNHQSPVLKGHHLRRVKLLLDHGINLLGYHLPLDRHPEVGNNAPALRALGLQELEPFAMAKGTSVGWKGKFQKPLLAEEFHRALEHYYGVKSIAFLEGPPEIRTVGMVSGGAQAELSTAIEAGLDAFVTGEISEYNLHLAREEGIHHFSLGHHASERIGPKCLAEWINKHFDVEAEFVDVPNPA